MYLANKKVKGLSLKHPLAEHALDLDAEAQTELVQALRSGNMEVVETLLRCHIGRAIQIAGRYAKFFRQNSEELVSVAIEAMWDGLLQAPEKLEHDEITPYLVVKAHGYLERFILRDRAVRVSRQTVKGFTRLSLAELNGRTPLAKSYERYVEMKDALDRSMRTADERRIIDLRRQGYTDTEIAMITGLSKTQVNILRHRVEERFDKEMSE